MSIHGFGSGGGVSSGEENYFADYTEGDRSQNGRVYDATFDLFQDPSNFSDLYPGLKDRDPFGFVESPDGSSTLGSEAGITGERLQSLLVRGATDGLVILDSEVAPPIEDTHSHSSNPQYDWLSSREQLSSDQSQDAAPVAEAIPAYIQAPVAPNTMPASVQPQAAAPAAEAIPAYSQAPVAPNTMPASVQPQAAKTAPAKRKYNIENKNLAQQEKKELRMMKNRQSARLSRKRKTEKMLQLEASVFDLTQRNNDLAGRLMEHEPAFHSRNQDREKILQLETRVSDLTKQNNDLTVRLMEHESAFHSRNQDGEKILQLETRVSDLTKQNDYLDRRVKELEDENLCLRS